MAHCPHCGGAIDALLIAGTGAASLRASGTVTGTSAPRSKRKPPKPFKSWEAWSKSMRRRIGKKKRKRR